jgi:hypothetical protein
MAPPGCPVRPLFIAHFDSSAWHIWPGRMLVSQKRSRPKPKVPQTPLSRMRRGGTSGLSANPGTKVYLGRVDVADDFAESVNRSADGMIQNHGDQAEAHARRILARVVTEKDRVGERMWLAILKAIEKKQRTIGP